MVMKNKLSKHHNSKLHYVVRKFSIGTASVAGFFAVIALPTYISINQHPQQAVLASENTPSENTQEQEEILVIEEVEETQTEE